MTYKPFAASALALIMVLGGCSAEPEAATNQAMAANIADETVVAQDVPDNAAPAPTPTASATASSKTIGLEGLGDLRIGRPVPTGSSWAERGAQENDACRTVSSPDYPGAYAIVSDGAVRRITIGQRSDVKLVEGIGVGSSETDVMKGFAGFRAEPHKYEEAPAKYLTAPNAASGDPAVRFEIGTGGKVKLLHVGTMPVLGYVEGCS